jgi:flagellar motility protein MotE (MotC chaperone)
MRTLRAMVIVGLVAKVLVLGAWWRTALAARSAEAASEPRPAAASEARPAPPAGEPRAATALAAEAGVPADLFARSRGFRDVLEAVQQRGTALDEREQAIASREAALKALEKTLADEITRIEALTRPAGAKPAGAGADTAAGAAAQAPSAGPALTKIYYTMKPEEAGPILDKLDDPTLVGILGRMKERNLGSILAAMNRDRAVAVTKALAAGEVSAAAR